MSTISDKANDWSESKIKVYGYAGHTQRCEAYVAGYEQAVLDKPKWIEIIKSGVYENIIAKRPHGSVKLFVRAGGSALLHMGFTHYMLEKDLVKL